MKTGKVELGQGTVTATMQLVADELDVPFELGQVRPVRHVVDAGPGLRRPAASRPATQNGPAGVRQAAAEARLALLDMASAKLGAPGREPDGLERRRQRRRRPVPVGLVCRA